MITLLCSILILIIGYFVYGEICERIFDIDTNRPTPALKEADGVDFVALPRWKSFLIQFLNIAGLGPIFGAVAGATWSNTGDRKIFIGWMSNWLYANVVPTKEWRSAMTFPRELNLEKVGSEFFITSLPVEELDEFITNEEIIRDVAVEEGIYDLSKELQPFQARYRLELTVESEDFSIHLNNKQGEEVVLGFDKASNSYYIDRSNSGKVDFKSDFAKRSVAPRIAKDDEIKLTLLVDIASVEIFADGGLSSLTGIFFPNEDLTGFYIKAPKIAFLSELKYGGINSGN